MAVTAPCCGNVSFSAYDFNQWRIQNVRLTLETNESHTIVVNFVCHYLYECRVYVVVVVDFDVFVGLCVFWHTILVSFSIFSIVGLTFYAQAILRAAL